MEDLQDEAQPIIYRRRRVPKYKRQIFASMPTISELEEQYSPVGAIQVNQGIEEP